MAVESGGEWVGAAEVRHWREGESGWVMLRCCGWGRDNVLCSVL